MFQYRDDQNDEYETIVQQINEEKQDQEVEGGISGIFYDGFGEQKGKDDACYLVLFVADESA